MKIAFPGCHSQDVFCPQWHACLGALLCLPLPGRVGRARMALQSWEGARQEGGVGAAETVLFPNQDLAGTQPRAPGPQKIVHHLPNSSFSSSAKPSGSTCLPRVWSFLVVWDSP